MTILPAPPPNDASDFSSIDPAEVRRVDDLDAAAGVGAAEPAPPGDPSPGSQGDGSPEASPPPVLDFEAWFTMMHAAFGLASAVTRLKSLAFDKGLATARPAFEAVYETAKEIPQLNFLVAPSGKWLGRVGAVAAFALPLGQAVRAEVQARRGGAPRAAGDGSAASPPAAGIPGMPSPAFYANLKGAEAGATQ